MNKDAVLATIIGFSIGLVVTAILLFGPTIVNSIQSIQLPKLATVSPTTSPLVPSDTPATLGAQQGVLVIDAPQNESLANTSELLVSGTAQPGSTVAITGTLDDAISTVGSDGKFAAAVTLVEGKNDIHISSLADGKFVSQSIAVYYTPENF